MNSSWSRSGSFMRPARQSALACSIRSCDEETKFHSMKRSPDGLAAQQHDDGRRGREHGIRSRREDQHAPASKVCPVDLDPTGHE